MSTNEITRKKQNYELCHIGAYGNRIKQWESLEEWRASGYSEPVAMRVAMSSGGGGPSVFNVTPDDVLKQVDIWESVGISPDRIRLAEMADGLRILQGEYLNDIYIRDGRFHSGMFLHTFETGPMPIALKKSKAYSYGLQANFLIRSRMTPSSYSDWCDLLERYPAHVLEVSVWEKCLGDIPDRNAIVWEIRKY